MKPPRPPLFRRPVFITACFAASWCGLNGVALSAPGIDENGTTVGSTPMPESSEAIDRGEVEGDRGRADSPPLGGPAPAVSTGTTSCRDAHTALDILGPTNQSAGFSNGRLMIGVSPEGILTTLRWPNLAEHDHLYYSSAALKKVPYGTLLKGGAPWEGSFAGLYIRSGRSHAGLHWLHEPNWRVTQSYQEEDSKVLMTDWVDNDLSLLLRGLDWVDPEKDIFYRSFRIENTSARDPVRLSFYYYANLSPNLRKTPFVMFHGWLDDEKNDPGMAYEPTHGALLAFKNSSLDTRSMEGLSRGVLSSPEVLERFLGRDIGPGVYVGVVLDVGADSYQVGSLSAEDGPTQSSYLDVQDGNLRRNPLVIGPASGLLGAEMTLAPGEERIVTAAIVLSRDYEGLTRLFESAFSLAIEDRLERSREHSRGWLERAPMPASPDRKLRRVSKRAMLNLHSAIHPDSGMIIGGLVTQPPYAYDWPNEILLHLVLPRTGYVEEARKHALYYLSAQASAEHPGIAPEGSFGMCYDSTGMPVGFLPFKIDSTAFAVWHWWDVARWLPAEDSKDYLREVYPSLRKAADLLRDWRQENGLTAPATEGDYPGKRSTLQGNLPVWAAMVAASHAAQAAAEDTRVVQSYEDRASELKTAILESFYLPEEDRFHEGDHIGAYAKFGNAYWMLWPERFLPPEDPRIQGHAAYVARGLEETLLAEKESTGAYDAKGLLFLVHAWEGQPEKLAQAKRYLDVLSRKVAMRGTDSYGEAWVLCDFDGDGRKEFDPRVAMPHVSEGVWTYWAGKQLYERLEVPSPSGPLVLSGVTTETAGEDLLVSWRLSDEATGAYVELSSDGLYYHEAWEVEGEGPHEIPGLAAHHRYYLKLTPYDSWGNEGETTGPIHVARSAAGTVRGTAPGCTCATITHAGAESGASSPLDAIPWVIVVAAVRRLRSPVRSAPLVAS